MKRWDLKPNLLDCILEERIAPAIANLGVIALTTSGFSLVTPFPGASNSASGSLGSGGGTQTTAASVSGAAMPTSFYITGTRGISTFMPGNFTGNPSIGGAVTGSANGVSLTIQVGSGSDDASASSGAGAASSSRTSQGQGPTATSTLAYIGQVSTSSGSSTPSTSQGSQQTQSAPVPSLPPLGVVIPGSPSGTSPGASSPMNPQMGAPSLMQGLGGRLMPTLPGGLGVPTSVFPMGPGGN